MKNQEIQLFCLPYAGGSAYVFNRWRRRLSESIELQPLELPGRGRRMNEPLSVSIATAVDDLMSCMTPLLNGKPYAIFGHSMGSLLAFELAHRLRSKSLPEPQLLILSGRIAPHVPFRSRKVHLMGEAELRAELLQVSNMNKELFDFPSLGAIFLPIIRADYRMIETYTYTPNSERLSSDLVLIYGIDDMTMDGSMDDWGVHTYGVYEKFGFQGVTFSSMSMRSRSYL